MARHRCGPVRRVAHEEQRGVLDRFRHLIEPRHAHRDVPLVEPRTHALFFQHSTEIEHPLGITATVGDEHVVHGVSFPLGLGHGTTDAHTERAAGSAVDVQQLRVEPAAVGLGPEHVKECVVVQRSWNFR